MRYKILFIFLLFASNIFSQEKIPLHLRNHSVSLSIGLYKDFSTEQPNTNYNPIYFDLGLQYSYRSNSILGYGIGFDFHSLDNSGGVIDFTIMPKVHFDFMKNYLSLYIGAGGLLARASSSEWKTFLYGFAVSAECKYNIDKTKSLGIEIKHPHYIRAINTIAFISNFSFSINF